MLCSPGGGGYGQPAEREPDLVLEDVTEGYVSDREARGEVWGGYRQRKRRAQG